MSEPSTWLVAQLRLSLFRTEAGVDSLDLKSVIGVEAESIQMNGPAKERQETAPFGPGRIVLVNHLGRVDLIWEAEVSDKFGSLGAYDEVSATLLPGMQAYAAASAWKRIAVGAVVGCKVADTPTGYALINDRVKELNLPPSGISDLTFQINRPRTLEVGGREVPINQLTKWMVQRLDHILVPLQVGSGVLPMLPPAPRVPDYRAVCEIDVNTVAEWVGVHEGPAVAELLQALNNVVSGIAAHGHHS